jgi:hypothetical protein
MLLIVRTPSRRGLVRALTGAVILTGLIGVWQHVPANYDAGPLDVSYADSWETLSELSRWLLALTKSVGPAPPLAPAALVEAGLSVLFATRTA